MDSTFIVILFATAMGVISILMTAVILIASFLILERMKNIVVIDGRLQNVEKYLADLSADVDASMGTPVGQMTPVFRSVDGKYTANSLEELMQKMAEGGELDFDPNDEDALRNFFKQMNEMDDDEDDEGWKKGKSK